MREAPSSMRARTGVTFVVPMISAEVISTYDAGTGVEKLRVQVTLATGIPQEVCRAANLGYLDPDSLDIDSFAADPETLVVPRAGEVLFRLRPHNLQDGPVDSRRTTRGEHRG